MLLRKRRKGRRRGPRRIRTSTVDKDNSVELHVPASIPAVNHISLRCWHGLREGLGEHELTLTLREHKFEYDEKGVKLADDCYSE